MYYKDMEVWKESIELPIDIYTLTDNFPSDEKYSIVSQMRRSAVSVSSNIAEGCTRKSKKETIRFIDISIGSLAELDTQLIIAERLNYTNEDSNIKTRISKIFALLRGLRKQQEESIITS